MIWDDFHAFHQCTQTNTRYQHKFQFNPDEKSIFIDLKKTLYPTMIHHILTPIRFVAVQFLPRFMKCEHVWLNVRNPRNDQHSCFFRYYFFGGVLVRKTRENYAQFTAIIFKICVVVYVYRLFAVNFARYSWKLSMPRWHVFELLELCVTSVECIWEAFVSNKMAKRASFQIDLR